MLLAAGDRAFHGAAEALIHRLELQPRIRTAFVAGLRAALLCSYVDRRPAVIVGHDARPKL
jgi:hypothetical protein